MLSMNFMGIENLNKMAMEKFRFFRTVYLNITGQGYKDKSRSNTAFLDGMKPVVFVGRMLCVISRNDVLKKQESQKRINYAAIPSGFLMCFFFIYAILLTRANIIRFYGDTTISEKLGEFSLPSYAWTMFFVYAYQLFGAKRFRNVIQSFMNANERSHMSTPFPSTFPRFCYIMVVICMICGVMENVLFDVQNLKKSKEKADLETNSTLEYYYTQTFYHWHHVIPYHPVVTVLYAIMVKCGTWGWVYMDTITITLCRAITEKFRVLNFQVNHLINPKNSALSLKSKLEEGRIMSQTWDSIRDEFVMLADLVLVIQKFISPLILACYGSNMYIAVITLFYWIAPYSKFSLEESSYNYFAFLQFMFRVSIVTYFAAEVHEVSHSIKKNIHRCPNSLYSISLKRLERNLICNPVGISLFGSFMITRKFFISIISFVFTTEIVLLQTARIPSTAI